MSLLCVLQAKEETAAELGRELELQRTELTRVSYVASKAAAREAAALKEEGTVPFSQYKDEVRLIPIDGLSHSSL